MYPSLPIGGLVLPTTPLTLIVGMWAALTYIERAAKRLVPAQADKIYNLASTGLFGGIIGARLLFVVAHWSAYQNNLLGLVWPITSGFNVGGGLVVGALVAFFYGRFHQLDPATTSDILAPGIIIILIAVSLSDFLGGPGYGTLSNLPWAISLFGLRRHPVQIYEMLIGLAALGLWWHNSQKWYFTGHLFLSTFALYSAGRLFVDAFRDNSLLTADGYHIIQIISLTLLLATLFILARYAPTSQD